MKEMNVVPYSLSLLGYFTGFVSRIFSAGATVAKMQ